MFDPGKKIAFLVVLAVYTFVVGIFGFKMGVRSVDQPVAAEQPAPEPKAAETAALASEAIDLAVIGELKSTLREMNNLNGDPEAEETKRYLERLAVFRDNLARLEQNIGQDRNSDLYKGQADRLISAIQRERAILGDVEIVLKNPSAAQEAINRVNSQVAVLIPETAGLKLNSLDLGYAFQLDDLASGLGVYVSRKHALDDAKRAEDERNAIRARDGG